MLTWLQRQIPWGGSLPLSWPRSRSMQWQSAPCMTVKYHVYGFLLQSSIGTCQILEGCAEFSKKLTERMPGRCFCHYFCKLPHLQIAGRLGNDLVEGYVHSDANILFGSLKRWLPKNHWELPELLEIEFEAILPGRKQLDQRYTKHPVIRKNFSTKPVRGMSLRKLLCLAQIWHQ